MRHLSTAAIVLVIAVLFGIGAEPTESQQLACGPRDGVIENLQKQFSEERAAVAVSSAGSLVEVMTSSEGTWTILVTLPHGETCVAADGYGWQDLNAAKHEKFTRAAATHIPTN